MTEFRVDTVGMIFDPARKRRQRGSLVRSTALWNSGFEWVRASLTPYIQSNGERRKCIQHTGFIVKCVSIARMNMTIGGI